MNKEKLQIYLAGLLQVMIVILVLAGLKSSVTAVLLIPLVVASFVFIYKAINNLKASQADLEKQVVEGAIDLKRSEERLHLIMEDSPMALFLKDCNGGYLFVNKSFEEKIGVGREEIVGRNDINLLSSSQAQSEMEMDQKLILNGVPFEYELKLPNKDGTERNFWITKHRISCEEGNTCVIVGSARDITERKQTEQQLTILLSAIEQSPLSVVITDKKGDIEYVNSCFTRVSGYSYNEAIGLNPRVLKSGHQSTAYYKQLWETILSGNVWKGEFLNRRKNGEEYWENAAIAPIVDEEGNVTHFVAVKEDISQRKSAENKLHQAKLSAEAANRAKNTFLASMSHELRTPLNTILGYSQLLRNDLTLGEEQQSHLQIMWKSGKRLLQLINSVLEMSRIESGKMELNKKSFNIHHLLQDVVQMFANPLEERGIELKVEEDNSISPSVVQDESKIRLILVNLLRNAVNFSREGQIIIRLQCIRYNNEKLTGIPFQTDGKGILLKFEVQDTGLGIELEDHDRIFRSFEQGVEGRKIEGGSGLGLAISRNFARMMGGDVVLIHSAPGKGSLFRAVIMAQPTDDEHIQKEVVHKTVEKLKPGQQEYKILFVDKNGENVESVVKTLSSTGFQVEIASDGNDAVSILKKSTFHCVIMDLGTPQVDELEAVTELRKLPNGNGIAVIAILDRDYDTLETDFFAKYVNGILRNPLIKEELFGEMRKGLGVEYSYVTGSVHKSSTNIMEIYRSDIGNLPLRLRKGIFQAAQIGDLGKLDAHIKAIDPQFASLKDELIDRLSRLDMEALTETFKNGKDHNE